MAQPKKLPPVPNPFNMEGEGFPIDVQHVSLEGAVVGQAVAVNLDFMRASAPDRKFVADGFCLIESASFARLLFVQTRFDGVTPRALLDIRMSHHALKDSVSEIFKAMPAEIVNMPEPFQLTEEPEQAVALEANFFRASLNASSSCIDFFYASPFSLLAVTSLKKLFVEGVVRVQLPDTVFVAVVSSLRKLNSLNGVKSGNDFIQRS